MDRDVNGENRDSTDSELIDLYNELLDKLEKVSSEKKKLEESQDTLKAELLKLESYARDLEEQLEKINTRIVVDKNNRYVRKVEKLKEKKKKVVNEAPSIIGDLKSLEKGSPKTPMEVMISSREYFSSTISFIIDNYGIKILGVLLMMISVILLVAGITVAGTSGEVFYMVILSLLSMFFGVFGVGYGQAVKEMFFFNLLPSAEKKSRQLDRQKEKINKKIEKLKDVIEKKYNIKFEDIYNDVASLKDEIILRIDNNNAKISELKDKTITNSWKIEKLGQEEEELMIRKKQVDTKLLLFIPQKELNNEVNDVLDKTKIVGSDETVETVSNDVISKESKPKQYKKSHTSNTKIKYSKQ